MREARRNVKSRKRTNEQRKMRERRESMICSNRGDVDTVSMKKW